ncbi:MAG: hypothetical protein KDM63_00050 [Verrucomicrobiae bacterium]|nr:hypothetical protein [Verrucomicrobiae bacterium]MCB1085406.1 hypothetical protein [Verrucomicrobiae bacterium]MCB1089960.1 hypothetical protein [Verrucomicrobiae bacterium]
MSKSAKPLLRAGLITDLHYADKTVRGSRHYRETLDKIAEAGTAFDKAQTDFVVELVALDTKHPQHEEKRSLEWR